MLTDTRSLPDRSLEIKRSSDQDSHILELTEKDISSTGFPTSTKEVSAGSPRVLIKDPKTHFKNKYVTCCKGDSVTCAGNTEKLNTNYRTSCNLGAEKPSAGKGIKNYVTHIKNYFQQDSYLKTHQKDSFWVIFFPWCYCFQRARPRPVTSSFRQRRHKNHQDLKDEKNSDFSEMFWGARVTDWTRCQKNDRVWQRENLKNNLHSAQKLLASKK